MLPIFEVRTIDPQNYPPEHTYIIYGIVDVALLWYYDLFIDKHGGFSEAS